MFVLLIIPDTITGPRYLIMPSTPSYASLAQITIMANKNSFDLQIHAILICLTRIKRTCVTDWTQYARLAAAGWSITSQFDRRPKVGSDKLMGMRTSLTILPVE